MISSNINHVSPVSVQGLSSADPQETQAQLASIDLAQSQLKTIDTTLATPTTQPVNAETLAIIANQQKQVVLTMVSGNSEQAIAVALAQSIESYGKQLEIIQGWTNGGLAMFESAMAVMFDGIKESGEVSGYAIEDLFQLAIMDFMSHGYGSDMDEAMRHFLESTGSGSHGYHENWDGEKFASECQGIFNYMMDNAPEDSLCHDVLTYMNEKCGGVTELQKQYRNSFNNTGGFVCDSGYPSSAGLSPMLRMALMAGYLTANPKVEQSTIEMFLTAPIGTLDTFIQTNTSYSSAIDFVFDNDGYQDDPTHDGWRKVSQNNHQVIDWEGEGLGSEYFENMYKDFPPRELTDEDVEKINRIGDQVKMLQQTLKYWLSICRDEQMAIARNI
ncbi:hypothetical protein ACODM8_17725 [Vibrio ostreicida]|uniref:hypothetical protein n=1 Tax=Vibrio ostreicida TaxID=526588 RepID=UPI003B5C86B3